MNQQSANYGMVGLRLDFFNIFLHWKQLSSLGGAEDIYLMNLYGLTGMIGYRNGYLHNWPLTVENANLEVINGEMLDAVDGNIQLRHVDVGKIIDLCCDDHLSLPGDNVETEILHGGNCDFFYYFFLLIFQKISNIVIKSNLDMMWLWVGDHKGGIGFLAIFSFKGS